ncbi:UDP-glucuronic acid decarboxylase family protein [Methylobacterium sp. EM32]|uniref:UDP-glucuronic acid decarboxylase family protein n=1 Tax=Methylobacterium sp. EM32 TaxID=3163481 RepID=UPI0033A1CE5E
MRHRESTLVLVAGGAGFLGSHLCDRLLAEGHEVVCLDHFGTGRRRNLRHLEREPRFDLVTHDVVEPLPARLRRQRFARIYNLACPASPPHYQADPEHTLLTSVLGTRHLLLAAEESGARLLQASTSEIYGDPEMHPQAEGYWGHVNPTGPRACYDEGKRAAETLCADYARAGRAAVRVARIFNTYGPRMRADDGRVVSNVICQALAGDDVTVYGDGSQTRSFCYVDDLIDGLHRLMEHPAEARDIGAVNLGNPVELTVSDLVRRVLALTGSTATVVNHPLPVDDPRRRRPDITRAGALLGWAPRVPLEQGLRATVMWFSDEAEDGPRAGRRPGLAAPAAVVA